MKKFVAVFVNVLIFSSHAVATGLATCDSGPEEQWRSQVELREKLEKQGWEVRRIKVDAGCYEVYALNEDGERVEAYFHPETLKPVATED